MGEGRNFMTVSELKAFLAKCPDDAEVWYEDRNFGGTGEEFNYGSIKLEDGLVLVNTPLWYPVD